MDINESKDSSHNLLIFNELAWGMSNICITFIPGFKNIHYVVGE